MHEKKAAVALSLALGLAVGVCATPARASLGEPVTTAVAGPESTVAGPSQAGSRRKGRLRLALSLRDTDYSTHVGLSRVRIHGVVRRGGGGRAKVFVANLTDVGNSSWTGATTLRHLAPGRYRIRLRSATAAIDVPGGTVRPRRLGTSAHVRVRPGRTRAVNLAPALPDSFSILMSGQLISPDGAPIGGLPVCGLAVSRFSFAKHCDPSGSDGRFVIELLPFADVVDAWEALQFGDEAEDLPWRTVVVNPREIGNSVITLQPRGVVTGIVTGGSGQPLAGRSVCSAPLSGHYGGAAWVVQADAWCTTTGADGRYRLRAEDGAQLFLGGDTGVISAGFIRRMDQYLSQETAQPPLFLRDVTALPESLIGAPQRPHPGPFPEEEVQNTRFSAGGQIDFRLADLVRGRDVTVTGSVSRVPIPGTAVGTIGAGEPVCAFSRAGYVCTEADAAGQFELRAPTWVEPSSPGSVIVKIVAPSTYTSWQPAAVRSVVAPGSALEQPLLLTPW